MFQKRNKILQMKHEHQMKKHKLFSKSPNVQRNIGVQREIRVIKTTPKEECILPEEIWIAGKGKSFDTYDWTQANQYRIGINETAFLVPDCWGAIALDHKILQKFETTLKKNIKVFLKHTQFKFAFPNQFVWSPADSQAIVFGTANAALCLFYWLGARKIHLVGFDSITGDATYAKRILDINAKGRNSDKYYRINKKLVDWIITKKDLTVIFEHDHSIDCRRLAIDVYSNNSYRR